MHRKIVIGLVLLLWTFIANGQQTRWFVGSGLAYSSFQDVRFSNEQISGIGGNFLETGFQRLSEKHIWGANAQVSYVPGANFTGRDVRNIHLVGRIFYHRAINERLYIGLNWDAYDFNTRSFTGLGNSENWYLTAMDIMPSIKYRYSLGANFELISGIDYSMLSFMLGAPSFSANFPQNIVEEGGTSFQDPNSRPLFALDKMEAFYPWQHFKLRTSFELRYKRRWSIAYEWYIRRFSPTEDYPITTGLHTLNLRFNILARPKPKKSEE